MYFELMNKRIPFFFLIVSVFLFLIIKIPALNLPHYWDEAFPYSYAIGFMTEHGAGLFTTAAPAEYTTGHPLLYYFLQASWNSMAGQTLWMQRLFPLLISIGCLWMTFLVGKKMFDARAGAGAALLLVTQSSFLALAAFQLPETLLTLLLLTTIFFLLDGRKLLFALSALLLLLVKEPAVVLLAVIFIFHFFIFLRQQPLIVRLQNVWMYFVPVGVSLLFYLHQYAVQGWLLFPRHTGYLSLTSGFAEQFSRYFAHLFIYSGRNALFFSALALLVFLLVKKRKTFVWSAALQNTLLLVLLIAGYLLFSAMNFYSNIYIHCLFPLFTLLVSASLYSTLRSFRWVYPVSVVALSAVTLFFSLNDKREADHSLGYANAVRCQRDAVRYCVEQGWQNQSILTGFLMQRNLTSHYPRYVSASEVFTTVFNNPDAPAAILIVTSNEKELHTHPDLAAMPLVKEFTTGNSWCRIYKK